jgi:hypothetical protein
MGERQAVVKLAAAPAATVMRQLRIVVEDGPAPLGPPIEVLSKAPVPAAHVSPPAPEPHAPAAAQGLVRVQAFSAAPVAAAPPRPLAKRIAPLAPVRAAAPRLQVAKARLARAPKPATAPGRLAKAAPALAKPSHRIELARAEAARAAVRKVEIARAEAARAAAHKVELARAEARTRAAKAARQEQIRLAQAEARGRAVARAEVRAEALAQARTAAARARVQLAKLARTPARAAPAKARPHARPVELARFERKPRPRREPPVQHVATRKAPRKAEPAYRHPPAAMAPQRSPEGLMKVSAPRCGAAHPCVDPAVGAAERQLARAYQGARAAGVPDAQLQRQQQRWLAARSAAAREAPWAVRDVYLARIAELNGLAHDARPDGY